MKTDKQGESGWILIRSGARSAFYNMEFDRIAQRRLDRAELGSFVRTFFFERSAMTIARSQSVEEIDLARALSIPIELARRHTGGGALAHDGDLSFSIGVARKTGARRLSASSLIELARLSAERALASFGARLDRVDRSTKPIRSRACLAMSSGLEGSIGRKKILPIAASVGRASVFAHGSLIISIDKERYLDLIRWRSIAEREAARSLIGRLDEIASGPIEAAALESAFIKSFSDLTGVSYDEPSVEFLDAVENEMRAEAGKNGVDEFGQKISRRL